MSGTLVYATANPEGVENHHGLYLNPVDIVDMVTQIERSSYAGTPILVHIEHKGVSVGRVLSAWEHAGRMECVLRIDNSVMEGAIGTEFVRNGMCKDLSLGYTVSLENSASGVRAKRKFLTEISIVKKGASNKCHIHGVSACTGPAASAVKCHVSACTGPAAKCHVSACTGPAAKRA